MDTIRRRRGRCRLHGLVPVPHTSLYALDKHSNRDAFIRLEKEKSELRSLAIGRRNSRTRAHRHNMHS